MLVTTNQKLKFREATIQVFTSIETQFGIPVTIGLAQSAHESNWGISKLATEGKNLFGITPGKVWLRAMRKEIPMDQVPSWSSIGAATIFFSTKEHSDHAPDKIRWWDFPGDIIEKKDDGKGGSNLVVNRYFRKYGNWSESAWDWARKISKTELYAPAYEASKTGDMALYAHALQVAGYATDPGYEKKLIESARAVAALPLAVA